MKFVRIGTSPDGGSQFSEFAVALPNQSRDPSGRTINRSDLIPASGVSLNELPEGLAVNLHPAPRSQLVIVLSGTVEVETSNGEKRVFQAGDLVFADNVESRGHKTSTVGGPAQLLFVHLPTDARPA
jgi:quercetin dioxygenase-like cupin family protein